MQAISPEHNEERLTHWRLLRPASSEKVRRASGVLETGCVISECLSSIFPVRAI